MATKQVLASIKQDIDSFVGNRVRLKSFKGRNKVVEKKASWSAPTQTFLSSNWKRRGFSAAFPSAIPMY